MEDSTLIYTTGLSIEVVREVPRVDPVTNIEFVIRVDVVIRFDSECSPPFLREAGRVAELYLSHMAHAMPEGVRSGDIDRPSSPASRLVSDVLSRMRNSVRSLGLRIDTDIVELVEGVRPSLPSAV